MRKVALLVSLVGIWGCSGGSSAPENPPLPDGRLELPRCEVERTAQSPLGTRCQQIVDSEGRVVLLHGINARVAGVFDVELEDVLFGEVHYQDRVPLEPIPELTVEDAQRMRQMGFNFMRLPIQWSGVEPTDEQPPSYDEAYLARVMSTVELCRAAGLWVLLDFHQDAYSKEIGEDGAPLWAIQPPPDVLLEGPLDDLGARRSSGDVLAAFRTFFGEQEPGPTLRTRFSKMVQFVAERFRGDDTVVGIEIFNEPLGSGIGLADPAIANAQIGAMNFEVSSDIRAVDEDRLIFFEPPVSPRNFTDESGVGATPFPELGAVYAPHVYSISFSAPDAEERHTFTRETLRFANKTAYEEAVAWGTPLVITEYGYDPFGVRAEEYLELQLDLHAEYGAGDALWLWKEDSQDGWGLHDFDEATDTWVERAFWRRLVSRPKPEAIAGQAQTWRYLADTGVLELWFRGDDDVTAPNIIYIPAPEDYAPHFTVSCDGSAISVQRDAATGQIQVPCNGDGGHYLRVEPN